MIAHLGLTDWLRLELTDELDVLGEFATSGAAPPRAALAVQRPLPLLPCSKRREGGSLLTGIGGDEALGSSRWARSMAVLSGGRAAATHATCRAWPCSLRRGPFGARSWFAALRSPSPGSGQRPPGRSRGHGPRTRRPSPRGWHSRLRASRPAARSGWALPSLERLAADAAATIAHPLLDPRFLAALAAAGGSVAGLTAPTAMRALFDGVLPSELAVALEQGALRRRVLGRPQPQLSPGHGPVRRPIRRWSIARALRQVWSQDEPDAHTYLLMQAAWLERQRADATRRSASTARGGRAPSLRGMSPPELEKAA